MNQHEHHSHGEEKHIVSYKDNIIIWVDLLLLTLVTIEIAQFDFKALTVIIALLVASIKTVLVGSTFMHLKFEKPWFRFMVYITAVVFLAFMVLLMLDYSTL
jgi:cytochrome c oxidase subunit 4